MAVTQSIAFSFGPDSNPAPLYDPRTLYEQCRDQGIPVESWWGKCNSFTNPLGEGPAKGLILLNRKDLERLDVDMAHTLTLKTDNVTTECKNLTILSAKCCTPGHPNEKNSVYYVEIADQRQHWARKLCGQRYNMVTADGMDYQASTINSDDPWTWREVLEELWGLAISDGSTVPTLDEAPHGVPENFDFTEDYALHALCVLLDRLGYALRWTPWNATGAYDIVRIGKDLTKAVDLDKTQDAWLWDDYPFSVTKARIPSKVNVLFRASPQDCNEERFCTVTVPRVQPVPNEETRDSDTTFIIHDDLIARRFTGSGSNPFAACITGSESGCSGVTGCCAYINETSLHERACERAQDYYRMLTQGADPFQRVYGGALKILPQSRYKAINWQDLGDGLKTTVYRGLDLLPPFGLWESWYKSLDVVCGGGGGGSMSGANVNFNFCSVVGPDCVIALSSQQCCNTTNGYYSIPIYMVVAAGGIHMFVDTENRAAAINFATDNGLSGCILGECPT